MKNEFKGWKITPIYIFDNPWNDLTDYTRVLSDVHVDLLHSWGKPTCEYYIGRACNCQLKHLNRFWLWNTTNYLRPFYKTKKTWGGEI